MPWLFAWRPRASYHPARCRGVRERPAHDTRACRGDRHTVNEKRQKLGWRSEPPAACTDGTVRDPSRDPNCRPVPEIYIEDGGTADDIALFHYLTKSKEDFEVKMVRGGGGGTHREWRHFEKIDACAPLAAARSCTRVLPAYRACRALCDMSLLRRFSNVWSAAARVQES